MTQPNSTRGSRRRARARARRRALAPVYDLVISIADSVAADMRTTSTDDHAEVSAARERVAVLAEMLFALSFAADRAHSLLSRRETLLSAELLDGGAR